MNSKLIAIGGAPGVGKSTVSKRLSTERSITRLSSDFLGQAIKKRSNDCLTDPSKAYWLGYELLFELAQEILDSGNSVIIDTNFGWDFQWQKFKQLQQSYPNAEFYPILLKAKPQIRLQRLQERYQQNPELYDPPESYQTEKIRKLETYLESISSKQAHFINAEQSIENIQHEIIGLISRNA